MSEIKDKNSEVGAAVSKAVPDRRLNVAYAASCCDDFQ